MRRLLHHPARLLLRLEYRRWERQLQRTLRSLGSDASRLKADHSVMEMQALLQNIHGVTARTPKRVRRAEQFLFWTLR